MPEIQVPFLGAMSRGVNATDMALTAMQNAHGPEEAARGVFQAINGVASGIQTEINNPQVQSHLTSYESSTAAQAATLLHQTRDMVAQMGNGPAGPGGPGGPREGGPGWGGPRPGWAGGGGRPGWGGGPGGPGWGRGPGGPGWGGGPGGPGGSGGPGAGFHLEQVQTNLEQAHQLFVGAYNQKAAELNQQPIQG